MPLTPAWNIKVSVITNVACPLIHKTDIIGTINKLFDSILLRPKLNVSNSKYRNNAM
jgi:hypothetical protein